MPGAVGGKPVEAYVNAILATLAGITGPESRYALMAAGGVTSARRRVPQAAPRRDRRPALHRPDLPRPGRGPRDPDAACSRCSSATGSNPSATRSGAVTERVARHRLQPRVRAPGRRPAVLARSRSRSPPGSTSGSSARTASARSTLFRVLAGQLPAAEGDVDIGAFAYMPQDVGVGPDSGAHGARAAAGGGARAAARRRRRGCSPPSASWRPAPTRPARACGSARRSATGPSSAATSSRASGTPRAGGSCARGSTRSAARETTQLSGGERKRLVLEVLFESDAAGAAARRARQLPRRPGQARARGADRRVAKTIC